MDKHRTAEEIFKNNIGHNIKAEVMSKKDFITIEGLLYDIACNQFFIKNEDETINMFRYEDLRCLYLIDKISTKQ